MLSTFCKFLEENKLVYRTIVLQKIMDKFLGGTKKYDRISLREFLYWIQDQSDTS